jgi:hypothetical protein
LTCVCERTVEGDPLEEIRKIVFDGKVVRLLGKASRPCLNFLVSLSTVNCLLNPAEIRRQKKHAEVLLTVPPTWRGN